MKSLGTIKAELREDIADAHITHSQTFQIIHLGVDTVQYEGGWWMKRDDYDRIWRYSTHFQRHMRDDSWGLDRNEDTRQITIFLMPQRKPHYQSFIKGENKNTL